MLSRSISKEIDGFNLNVLYFQSHSYRTRFTQANFKKSDPIATTYSHEIRKCIHDESDTKMAVKQIFLCDANIEKVEREVKILIELNRMKNDHVIQFYGYLIDNNFLYICSELMHCSLHDFYMKIKKSGHKIIFPEKLIGCVAKAVIDCLAYCKMNNIIHRDVKPRNILLKLTGEIKLCDFGDANFLQNSLASTLVGTILYWPPERFNEENREYDVRADIWSLGVTLVEVVCMRNPFKTRNDEELGLPMVQKKIMNVKTSDLLDRCFGENREKYSKCLWNFIARLLTKDVEHRPKYDQLMEDMFYTKFYCANPQIAAHEMNVKSLV